MLSARSGAPNGSSRSRSKPGARHRTPPRLNDPSYQQKPSVWRNLTSFSGAGSRPSIFSILNLDSSPKDKQKQDEDDPHQQEKEETGAPLQGPSANSKSDPSDEMAQDPFTVTRRDGRHAPTTQAVMGWCSVDDFLREDPPSEEAQGSPLLQNRADQVGHHLANVDGPTYDFQPARPSLATSASAFSFSPKARSANAAAAGEETEPSSDKSSSSSSSSISTASEGHSGSSSTSISHEEEEQGSASLEAAEPQKEAQKKNKLEVEKPAARARSAGVAGRNPVAAAGNKPRPGSISAAATIQTAALVSTTTIASPPSPHASIAASQSPASKAAAAATTAASAIVAASSTATAATLLASSIASKAAKPPRKRACSKGSAASLARCTMSRTPRTSGEPGPGSITPRSACPQSARRSQMDAAQVIEAEAHINSIFARLEARISKATASYADISAPTTPREDVGKSTEQSEKLQQIQQQQKQSSGFSAVGECSEHPSTLQNMEQPEPPPPPADPTMIATTTATIGSEAPRSSSKAKAKHASKQAKISSKSLGPSAIAPVEGGKVVGRKKDTLLASNGKAIKAFPIQMIAQPSQPMEVFEPEHEPRARPSTTSSAAESRKNSDSSRGSLELGLQQGRTRRATTTTRSRSASTSAQAQRSRNSSTLALTSVQMPAGSAPLKEPAPAHTLEPEAAKESLPPSAEGDITVKPTTEAAEEIVGSLDEEDATAPLPAAVPEPEAPALEADERPAPSSPLSSPVVEHQLQQHQHQERTNDEDQPQDHPQDQQQQPQRHRSHHAGARTPLSSSSNTPRSSRPRGDPRLCSQEQAERAKAALSRLQLQLVEESTGSGSHEDSIDSLELGDRVWVAVSKGLRAAGNVRYSGETSFAKGVWLGLELDDEVGKNDGSVAGVRYFDCAQGHGLFCRPSFVAKECGP